MAKKLPEPHKELGREIDIEIAEKIFGYKVYTVEEENYTRVAVAKSFKWSKSKIEQMIPKLLMYKITGGKSLPRYTQKIECAWELLERIMVADQTVIQPIVVGEGLKWSVSALTLTEIGDTVSEAICKLALSMKKVE